MLKIKSVSTTHTHIYIYIYIYALHACVCVCINQLLHMRWMWHKVDFLIQVLIQFYFSLTGCHIKGLELNIALL